MLAVIAAVMVFCVTTLVIAAVSHQWAGWFGVLCLAVGLTAGGVSILVWTRVRRA